VHGHPRNFGQSLDAHVTLPIPKIFYRPFIQTIPLGLCAFVSSTTFDWSFGWGLRTSIQSRGRGPGGRKESGMVPSDRAFMISYIRPSIQIIPISTRLPEILDWSFGLGFVGLTFPYHYTFQRYCRFCARHHHRRRSSSSSSSSSRGLNNKTMYFKDHNSKVSFVKYRLHDQTKVFRRCLGLKTPVQQR